MKRYIAWGKALLWHKWCVFIEACKLGVPWRGFMHDMDKFRPSIFIPYSRFHYDKDGKQIQRRDASGHYDGLNCGDPAFEKCIYDHFRYSSHHWESWVLVQLKDPGYKAFPMDEKSIREMLADWMGSSRSKGTIGVHKWYSINGHKNIMHSDTRARIEEILDLIERGKKISWPKN